MTVPAEQSRLVVLCRGSGFGSASARLGAALLLTSRWSNVTSLDVSFASAAFRHPFPPSRQLYWGSFALLAVRFQSGYDASSISPSLLMSPYRSAVIRTCLRCHPSRASDSNLLATLAVPRVLTAAGQLDSNDTVVCAVHKERENYPLVICSHLV